MSIDAEITHFPEDGYWLVSGWDDVIEGLGFRNGREVEDAVRRGLRRRKPLGIIRGITFDSELSCFVAVCKRRADAVLVAEVIRELAADRG